MGDKWYNVVHVDGAIRKQVYMMSDEVARHCPDGYFARMREVDANAVAMAASEQHGWDCELREWKKEGVTMSEHTHRLGKWYAAVFNVAVKWEGQCLTGHDLFIHEHGITIMDEEIKNCNLLKTFRHELGHPHISVADLERIRRIIEAVHGKTLEELAGDGLRWVVIDRGAEEVGGSRKGTYLTRSAQGDILRWYSPISGLPMSKAQAATLALDVYNEHGWHCKAMELPTDE